MYRKDVCWELVSTVVILCMTFMMCLMCLMCMMVVICVSIGNHNDLYDIYRSGTCIA